VSTPLPGQLGFPGVKEDVPLEGNYDDPQILDARQADIMHFLYGLACRFNMNVNDLWVATVLGLQDVVDTLEHHDAVREMKKRVSTQGRNP
jgi:hypothetical protein